MEAISAEEFKNWVDQEISVIDTRAADDFAQGFIPQSINIPATSQLPEYSSLFFKTDEDLLLVANDGEELAVAEELKKSGFNKLKGYLKGGFPTWKKADYPIDMVIDVDPDELMMDIPFDENLVVIDVRRPIDFAQGHLKDATNIPLEEISTIENIAQIEETDNLYLHCYVGVRSVIAASVLKNTAFII
ncbi:rhodanese-like domain-containing protein [Niabella ginsengisoli]|uniref:Rhodanese-like domain-containing protein n=1 Tax=Niabella ginsengisoli TaxID=522298 RepID=A0ABS9SPL7_9BACT|nr:rhodanese-like domain-containing protein [Niabella ginsengisoli]MCH5600316.1 rhodanese-like domain-containing protein [Niabella ginsengisoli]